MQLHSRIIPAILILLSISGGTHSQELSDVFPAVVFLQGNKIRHEKLDGKDVEIWVKDPTKVSPEPLKVPSSGSGFIVLHDSRLFLVTAQHVVADIPLDPMATLRGPNDDPLTFALSEIAAEKPIRWTHHTEADVAVLPLTPPKAFRAVIKAVTFEQLATQDTAPGMDLFLTTVGFPLQLGVTGKFSPIVKVSHPASAFFRYPRFDNKRETTFFILADPSVAGFSGAPVFKLPSVHVGVIASSQGVFECVGMVHGTLNDPTGGKFAAIVPARFVAETVSMAAKKD